MAEYIEREALKKELQKKVELSRKARYALIEEDFEDIINDMPAADVAEVKHGEWHCSSVSMKTRNITCRHCRRTETISNGRENFDYCPNCGARMDGEGE